MIHDKGIFRWYLNLDVGKDPGAWWRVRDLHSRFTQPNPQTLVLNLQSTVTSWWGWGSQDPLAGSTVTPLNSPLAPPTPLFFFPVFSVSLLLFLRSLLCLAFLPFCSFLAPLLPPFLQGLHFFLTNTLSCINPKHPNYTIVYIISWIYWISLMFPSLRF